MFQSALDDNIFFQLYVINAKPKTKFRLNLKINYICFIIENIKIEAEFRFTILALKSKLAILILRLRKVFENSILWFKINF